MTNTLKAEKRELTGKKVKSLRKQGLTPAVIFNSKGECDNITINASELVKAIRGATKATIFEIDYNGEKFKTILKEVQDNTVTDELKHAAFFKIDENATMVFDIPFVLSGVSLAVKNNLGTLFQPLNSVQVRCKLSDLVPSFNVDISVLERVGQTIKVGDLKIPASIKIIHKEDLEATVVTITEIQEEVVEVVEETLASTEVKPGAEGEAGAEGAEGAVATDAKGGAKDADKGGDKKAKK
jgi:large subunit ribosomal protein L25